MTLSRTLSAVAVAVLLAGCATALAGPPPNATHPAWLTGTWQGSAWQIAAPQTQGHTEFTLTFVADGSWKASTGASGTSWLDGDRVVLLGVAANGARIRYAFKEREGAGGHEIWGVVEASYGAAAVSLKRAR